MPNPSVPSRAMREKPDLDQLKRQAKELLDAFLRGEEGAIREVATHFRVSDLQAFALHDAQLVLARAYGFASWPKLKAYVDGVTVRRLVEYVRAGDVQQVPAMLGVRPELACMCVAEHDEHLALHYAVLDQHPEMVLMLMRHGASARRGIYPHREATSAYTLAVERGYNQIVDIIEEEESRRAETRWRGDDRGRSLPEFEEAARQGDEERIIAFYEADPTLLQATDYLLTPLHRAVSSLWERVTVWLLDHGADVNARIDGGPSPLEIVGCGFGPGRLGDPAKTGRLVKILRDRGAELTPRAAVAYGEGEWLKVRQAEGKLIHKLPRNQGNRGLLEIAVYHERRDMLALLLDLGLDPNEPLKMGDSEEVRRGGPLLCAIRKGLVDMAELLVARGAELTPWAAVFLGREDWLKEKHASGEIANFIGTDRLRMDEGGGLVSMAVKHERPDMLKLLLELGFDPNERTRLDHDEPVFSAGEPLYYCVRANEIAMAEILLDYGADPNAQVYASGSPFWRAYRERDSRMIELLQGHGAIVTPDIAGYCRDTELAKELFRAEDAEALPKGAVSDGQSVAEAILDPAVSGGADEIVRLALARLGWKPDDPRWAGVLRSATRFWHHNPSIQSEKWVVDRGVYLRCFQLLLERADPNVRSRALGQTPLHDVAAMRDWSTDDEVVQFAQALLERGARADLRDDVLKSSPLGWACRWGRAGMVRLLLERGADRDEPDAEAWARPRAWAERGKHRAILDLLA